MPSKLLGALPMKDAIKGFASGLLLQHLNYDLGNVSGPCWVAHLPGVHLLDAVQQIEV
jgi:hypothetical protein